MIAVCEPDPLYQRALLRFLRSLGYEAEALSKLRSSPAAQAVRAIVVDESRVDALPPDLRDRPQVILTSCSAARAVGLRTRWLPKPYTRQELAHALMLLSEGPTPDIGPGFHSRVRASVRASSGSRGSPDRGQRSASSIEDSQSDQ